MEINIFDRFSDKYLKTSGGQGVFLSGVVLGMVAKGQSANNVAESPMFKQITFGKMSTRDIHRHLGRIPELAKAYDIKYANLVTLLSGKAGELLLEDGTRDMGVDGNFAFATAFIGANNYFWEIFKKAVSVDEIQEQININDENEEEAN